MWSNGACLLIDRNGYYEYGRNRETLTEDELEAVVTKLMEMHPTLCVTNWKYLVTLWNDNNSRYAVDPDIKMPEYDFDTTSRYEEK